MLKESSSEASMDEDDSPNKDNVRIGNRAKQTPQWRESSSKVTHRNAKEDKDFVRNL